METALSGAPGATRDYFAPLALLPGGWSRDVAFAVDARGHFASVRSNATPNEATRIDGVMLPGMVNAHSHAFQRAMVGLTHRAGSNADNFWSWRSLMYALALKLTPDQVEAIATWVYTEMLRGGYTHVCEFHYIHNAPDGTPYADPAEMSRAILRAARRTGIGITLLPVLYMTNGFGGVPAREEQRRFLSTPERMLDLVRTLAGEHRDDPLFAIGLAPHSLRAVPPAGLDAAARGMHSLAPDAPIHIHIAEQTGEVDACVAWSGQRPVEWLLENQHIDARWNLVHATHMVPTEAQAVGAARAVVVLCPTTEADLGDGIFDYTTFAAAGGRIAIGTDSQVSRDWWSELRMLEYSQRLATRQRNVGASEGGSTGQALFVRSLSGGSQASGVKTGSIEAGHRADWLVVREGKLALAGRSQEYFLDSLIFDHHTADFADVVVGGVSRCDSLNGDRYVDARTAFARVLGEVAA